MKLNKIVAAAALVLCSLTANAQGMFEALRFATPDINGTARYMGMAGAFGALGADASAILDNPAALGVYRSSEMSFSLDVNPTYSVTNWNNEANASIHTRASFNNAGFVWNINTGRERGYLSSNFNFSYSRVRNFNRSLQGYTNTGSNSSIADYFANYTQGLSNSQLMNPDAYNDVNIGWLSVLGFDAGLIDPMSGADSTMWRPRYSGVTGRGITLFEKGGINEYNIGYGFNISDVFFFGTTFSAMDINYSLETRYDETTAENAFYLHNRLVTTGAGWNFKFGVIFCPVDFLRVGVSLHTPTFYTLTDRYYATAASTGNRNELQTPEAALTYRYKTPLKVQASLGFIISDRAAIDVDYMFTNVKRGCQLTSSRFGNGPFAEDNNDYYLDNEQISQFANNVHLVKAGAEIMLIPSTLPLRLGVAYMTPVVRDDARRNDPLTATHTNTDYALESSNIYASCGIGYRHKGFGIDLAYLMRNTQMKYMPYVSDDATVGSNVSSFAHNIDLTLSFRF